MKLEEMITARAEKLKAMKALNSNEMSDEQIAQFDSLRAEFNKLDRDIDLAKTEDKLTKEVDDILTPEKVNEITGNADYINAFNMYVKGENLKDAVNAMTEGVDADGGYLVPLEYQKTVLQKLNDLGATRGISSVIGTTSTRVIPTEGDAPTFNWVDEEGTYGETKSTFGQIQLGAYKLGGIIKVSEELLQDNMIGFDSYMAGQIARGIDKAESPAFAAGDGAKKPTGYATSAPVGASSTTAATDAVAADELIDIFYDLKAEYRKNATWRMTDKTEKAIRKLKDGNGNYIYDPKLDAQGRASLFGKPIVIDNDMAELGTSKKFIVIGNFNYYQIADRGGMSIQRLNEKYADTGMIGFRVHKRLDAKATLAEAFNAGQNAAS